MQEKGKRDIISKMCLVYPRPGGVNSAYSPDVSGTEKLQCPHDNLIAQRGRMRIREEDSKSSRKVSVSGVRGTHGELPRRRKRFYRKSLIQRQRLQPFGPRAASPFLHAYS